MDKSGRRALAANLKAITERSKSRRDWTLARRIDTKTAERAEKDEGEKGVSLQAVDDIAHGLGLAAWQLLVPGLDIESPPHLATDTAPPPDITQALQIVRDQLAQAHGETSARVGDALRLLALTPDSERAFNNALAALLTTRGEDSPRASGDESHMAHVTSYGGHETRPASSQVLGGKTDVRGEWTDKRVPGGTERTDESTTYRRPAVEPATKGAKK